MPKDYRPHDPVEVLGGVIAIMVVATIVVPFVGIYGAEYLLHSFHEFMNIDPENRMPGNFLLLLTIVSLVFIVFVVLFSKL